MPAFKNYQRTPRNLVTEQFFNKGMSYTDVPLMDGYCKTLVNYNISPEGNMLSPRAGYQRTHTVEHRRGPSVIHHIGYMQGYEEDTKSDYSILYTLLSSVEGLFIIVDTTCYNVILGEGVTGIRTSKVDEPSTIHGMRVDIPELENLPVYTHLNGKVILPTNDGLGILSSKKEGGVLIFNLDKVVPMEVNPSEASASGYNMLKEEPFNYGDKIGEAMTLGIQGIVPQDLEGKALFSASVGQLVRFRAYYETAQAADNTDYTVVWEFYSLETSKEPTRTIFRNVKIDPTASDKTVLSCNAPAEYKEFGVRITIYSGTYDVDPLVSTAVPVCTGVYSNYKMHDKAAKSMDPVAYDLSSATGMCTWMQHVVLWRTSRGRNMLFISELARPGYFPFPQNAQVFDEDVISCVPYLNALLVFTTTKIHKLSWLPGGEGFTSTVVQEKLQLSMFDHQTIKVVQTMVFFKSGDYYYMIVPKATADGVGALQIAPISSGITKLLDKMGPEVASILRNMYRTIGKTVPTLVGYTNYQDNGIMRCVYKFEVAPQRYIDFYLNYSTVLRTWTTYVMESTEQNVYLYRYGVTDGSVYASLYDNTFILITPSKDLHDDFLYGTSYDNLQYVDTGYREHSTATKKRYREVQLKINNTSRRSLQFGSMFMLDGTIRKDLYTYKVVKYDTEIVVEPEFLEPSLLAGNTVLSDDDNEDLVLRDGEYITESEELVMNTNTWQLGISSLTEPSVMKVRVKLSGKGYAPRLIILSLNTVPYELLGFNWVYRTMNAR